MEVDLKVNGIRADNPQETIKTSEKSTLQIEISKEIEENTSRSTNLLDSESRELI